MRMTASVVIAVLSALVAGEAQATSYTGTMCGQFNPSACGCNSQCGGLNGQYLKFLEASEFDDPVTMISADPIAPLQPSGKLVVFFHGHSGTPDAGIAFIQEAALRGFDAITLDYDYGRNHEPASALPPSVTFWPTDAACAHPFTNSKNETSCAADIDSVCGCYGDCYEARWASIWKGTNHAGLPSVGPDWTINARLIATLQWLSQHAGTQQERDRFASYLSNGQPNWSLITLAAHSLGASLAPYIAKNVAVDRVIMMSGVCEKMAPDGSAAGKNAWAGTGFGCGGNGGNGWGEDGGSYSFGSVSCKPTIYGYGSAAHNGVACKLSLLPIPWIADNQWTGGSTSTAWATDHGRFFGFADSDDLVCPWAAPDSKLDSTGLNWLTLGLRNLHRAPFYSNGYWVIVPPGWNEVGDWANPAGLQWGGWHGVVSSASDSTASQICNQNGVSGHSAVIAANACDDVNNTGPANNRQAVWDFLLTGTP